MVQTLAFLAACAVLLSVPFIWRARKKAKIRKAEYAYARDVMYDELAEALHHDVRGDTEIDHPKRGPR